MKKLITIALVLTFLSMAGNGFSALVSLSQTDPLPAMVGDPVAFDLEISRLGDHAPPALGAFELDIIYNADDLEFTSIAFGSELGPSTYSVQSGQGDLNILQVSWEDTQILVDEQPASFSLANIGFTLLGMTPGRLHLENIFLSDEAGNSIDVEIVFWPDGLPGTPIQMVPLPSSLLLLAGGLIAIGRMRRKNKINTEWLIFL